MCAVLKCCMFAAVQINLIFRFLQSRQKVQIWLYEQSDLRIEGRIIVSSGYLSYISFHGTVESPAAHSLEQ